MPNTVEKITVTIPVGTEFTITGTDKKGSFEATYKLAKSFAITLTGDAHVAMVEKRYINFSDTKTGRGDDTSHK